MKEKSPSLGRGAGFLRAVPAAIGGLVALTAGAVLVIVWMVTRDPTYGTNPEKPLHPIKVYTPFSFYNPAKLEEVAGRYKLPLYPGSAGHEHISSSWLLGPTGQPGRAAAVDLIRYHVGASPAQVDKWYQEQLGPGFRRSGGQAVGLGHGTKEWIGRFPAESNGEVALFQKEEIGQRERVTRGVILQPRAGGTGVLLTLFMYFEAPAWRPRTK